VSRPVSLDICHNHLYTNDPALRDFLNSKQDGGDWESCQSPCVGDFDQDGDVDGLDLSNYLQYPECIDLEGFAGKFGNAAAIDVVE